MALVNCHECQAEISDQAPSCPRCGAPMRQADEVQAGSPSSRRPKSKRLAPTTEKAKRSPLGTAVRVLLIATVAVLGGVPLVIHLSGTAKVGDLTSEITERAAAEAGVKTEKVRLTETLDRCLSEVVTAVQGMDGTEAAFLQKLTGEAPAAQDLRLALSNYVDAVRKAKDKVAALQTFLNLNREALNTHQLRTPADAPQVQARVEALEVQLAATRIQEHTVRGDRSWESAGVQAQAGDSVRVWATGQWKGHPSWPAVGPEGSNPDWAPRAVVALSNFIEEGENRQQLAAALLQITHPTGNTPRVHSIARVGNDGNLDATFTLSWKGGLIGTDYTTVVRWLAAEQGSITATVASDNSPVGQNQESQRALSRYMSDLWALIAARSDFRLFAKQAAGMTLIARVSSQESENTGFPIGKAGVFQAPSTGTVQFRSNDSTPNDNSGEVRVVVLVMPPRPN